MSEFTTCDASEDGACYFSADIAKLTAERDALLETVDALRTETERCRADLKAADVLKAEVERQSNLITAWENAYAVGELRPTYEALKTQLAELREAAEACIREMWGLEPDEPIVAAPVEPFSTFERLAWVLAKLQPQLIGSPHPMGPKDWADVEALVKAARVALPMMAGLDAHYGSRESGEAIDALADAVKVFEAVKPSAAPTITAIDHGFFEVSAVVHAKWDAEKQTLTVTKCEVLR